MVTGVHTVSDIFCRLCLHYIGWEYHFAYEPSQKYKEGKVVLERDKIEDRGPAPGSGAPWTVAGDGENPMVPPIGPRVCLTRPSAVLGRLGMERFQTPLTSDSDE